ncbi:hypothetical protein S40285_10848 [Stachybotrys chlorohalonatus IBT 40285]|uniref:Uncharacterized protein n=1 Tax=Stachybotrys chlorohalonatus (strain IBT 40285) TaxID=1283841 RepID=A0A084QCA6_STAC4|nr:hypothetical protein S40285_10848 [Stachybotrys chlorohalonata IBT 40285]
MLPKNSAKSSDALLDKLPPLVLDQICRYLAKYDGRSRRSLRSFSLANSRCYSVATSQLFRQLYLTLDAVRGIAGAIEASNATLGNDRLRFVHDLTICDSGNENRSGWPYELEQEEANYGDDGKGGPFHRTLAATRYFYGLPEGRKETTDEKNDRIQRWLPLANYLERLPSLASITWTHSDQVPSCIVEALKQRPRIKLIIETFSLRGAYQQGGRGQNMDPEECALIASPCLHTIVVPHFSYDDFGCWDYNGDAVKEIASSATPDGLTLLIPRSLGNAFETAIYRALGRLPVLEYIKLILDCTILDKTRFRLRLSESSGLFKPEESSEQEATFLRETLFNVAVDSTLAKSIFRTIAQSQSMETGIPYEALPLYRVVLEVLPDYQLYGEISNVCRWIGRNWVCERRSISEGDDVNGTLSFGVATKELNRLARLDAGSLLDDDPWWFQDSAFFKSVWNSLWPTGSSGDQGDWKNAWRSFPLSDL